MEVVDDVETKNNFGSLLPEIAVTKTKHKANMTFIVIELVTTDKWRQLWHEDRTFTYLYSDYDNQFSHIQDSGHWQTMMNIFDAKSPYNIKDDLMALSCSACLLQVYLFCDLNILQVVPTDDESSKTNSECQQHMGWRNLDYKYWFEVISIFLISCFLDCIEWFRIFSNETLLKKHHNFTS